MRGSAVSNAATIGLAFLYIVSASAAPTPTPIPAPSAPTPGAVQSTLPTQTKPPAQNIPAQVKLPSTAPASVAPGGATVTVKQFQIQGNSVFTDAELQAQIASYLNTPLTLAQLYDAADILTRYYRSHGYGLAYVSLPAQTLTGNTVRFEVIEGRIGKVSVQGNTRTHGESLMYRASGLHVGDVYTDAAAERAVLLMNDIPGVTSRAVVSPGTEYGTSDILFNVSEKGYGGDLSVDDYGRTAIGRWRFSADANVNSLTGHGDQLSGGITHSEGNLLNFGKLAYSVPVGAPGGTLTTAFNRAYYHVGGPVFGPLDIAGSTQNGAVNWLYPSTRTTDKSFYWGIGVNHNTSKTSVGGKALPPSTNITLLQVSTLYTRLFEDQSYWSLAGNFWSNGQHNDGTQNYAERLRFEFDSTYVHPFADRWSFINLASVEYSPDPLVDADKFSLGGPGNVRGFLSAEARGDQGAFLSMEVQRSFFPSPRYPLGWGFYIDSGKIWNKAVAAVPANHTTLTSVGTEWNLTPVGTGWNMRLQWAWAVGGVMPSDGGNRGGHIWFSMGTTF